jgi:hypothetical protein
MKKPLAKIGRQNHQNHLVKVMPILTIVYCLQCFVMYKFAHDINIGDYALSLGVMLAGLIVAMMYYDNNHQVMIYEDHLHLSFGLFGLDKKIPLRDIVDIQVPKKECPFSNVTIVTKDDKKHIFLFVDYPVQVKQTIESTRRGSFSEVEVKEAA